MLSQDSRPSTNPLPLGLAPPSLLVWLQSPPSLRLGLSSGSAPLAPTPPAGPPSLTSAILRLSTSVNLLLAGTAPDERLQHQT